LRFVQQRWAAGQVTELDQLSAELSEESTGADLARVATLCDDLARLKHADLALLDELVACHAGNEWPGGASARLYAKFRRAAAARRAQLA
jgi:hypothetical protein